MEIWNQACLTCVIMDNFLQEHLRRCGVGRPVRKEVLPSMGTCNLPLVLTARIPETNKRRTKGESIFISSEFWRPQVTWRAPRVQGRGKRIWGQKRFATWWSGLNSEALPFPPRGGLGGATSSRSSALNSARGSTRRCRWTLETFRPQGQGEDEDSSRKPGWSSAARGNTPNYAPQQPRASILCCPLWLHEPGVPGLLGGGKPALAPRGGGYLLGTSKLRQMAGRREDPHLVFP